MATANITTINSNSPRVAGDVPQPAFKHVLKNDTIKVESLAWDGDKPYTLNWDFGDGTVIEDGNEKETHIYTENGTYIVTHTVIDSDGDVANQKHDVNVKIVHYDDDVIVIDGFTHLAIIIPGLLALMIVGIKRNTKILSE